MRDFSNDFKLIETVFKVIYCVQNYFIFWATVPLINPLDTHSMFMSMTYHSPQTLIGSIPHIGGTKIAILTVDNIFPLII